MPVEINSFTQDCKSSLRKTVRSTGYHETRHTLNKKGKFHPISSCGNFGESPKNYVKTECFHRISTPVN